MRFLREKPDVVGLNVWSFAYIIITRKVSEFRYCILDGIGGGMKLGDENTTKRVERRKGKEGTDVPMMTQAMTSLQATVRIPSQTVDKV